MENFGVRRRKRLTMERTPRFRVRTPPLDKDLTVTEASKPRASHGARIALLTGMACAACCAVPWLGLAIGSSAIAGLAVYSEQAALAVAVTGAGIMLFKRLTRKTGPACEVDGPCGPGAQDRS